MLEETSDIQSEVILHGALTSSVHWQAPFTTLTPHSDSQSNFFSYMSSCVQYTMYKIIATCIERTTTLWPYNMCVTREYKAGESMPYYSQLIN